MSVCVNVGEKECTEGGTGNEDVKIQMEEQKHVGHFLPYFSDARATTLAVFSRVYTLNSLLTTVFIVSLPTSVSFYPSVCMPNPCLILFLLAIETLLHHQIVSLTAFLSF